MPESLPVLANRSINVIFSKPSIHVVHTIGVLIVALLSDLLFGVKAIEPLAFWGTALGLALVGLLASYIPARRAAHVDPMVALHLRVGQTEQSYVILIPSDSNVFLKWGSLML